MAREKLDPSITAASVKEWRQWLDHNHEQAEYVWLIIFHKKSDRQSIYWPEAVDEALCFGWIDSIRRKRDHESFYQYFTPRKPKSGWSRVNKEKIERLTRSGRMTKAGQQVIDEARKNGTWEALDQVEELIMPDDLQEAFDGNPSAWKNWNNFPPSSKRLILYWVTSAKRESTRKKRIKETVSQAAENIRANHFRQPKNQGKSSKK